MPFVGEKSNNAVVSTSLQELAQLERMFLAHYRPPTALEGEEVKRLAGLHWRLKRCGRIEAGILTDHGTEPQHEKDQDPYYYAGPGWGVTHDCSKFRSLQAASQMEERLNRQYSVLEKRLNEDLAARSRTVPKLVGCPADPLPAPGTPPLSSSGESPALLSPSPMQRLLAPIRKLVQASPRTASPDRASGKGVTVMDV
jgi:hypothetical protein